MNMAMGNAIVRVYWGHWGMSPTARPTCSFNAKVSQGPDG